MYTHAKQVEIEFSPGQLESRVAGPFRRDRCDARSRRADVRPVPLRCRVPWPVRPGPPHARRSERTGGEPARAGARFRWAAMARVTAARHTPTRSSRNASASHDTDYRTLDRNRTPTDWTHAVAIPIGSRPLHTPLGSAPHNAVTRRHMRSRHRDMCANQCHHTRS